MRGNLTKRGALEYYWDAQDHMTKVANGVVYFDGLTQVTDPMVANLTTSQNLRNYSTRKAIAYNGTVLFYNALPGTIGGLPLRSVWTGPGMFNLDLNLAKRIATLYHVDRFAQEVGVAAVAGVLLDHADQHLAQFCHQPQMCDARINPSDCIGYIGAVYGDFKKGRFIGKNNGAHFLEHAGSGPGFAALVRQVPVIIGRRKIIVYARKEIT